MPFKDKTTRAEWERARRESLIGKGLCARCRKPNASPDMNRSLCPTCNEGQKLAKRVYARTKASPRTAAVRAEKREQKDATTLRVRTRDDAVRNVLAVPDASMMQRAIMLAALTKRPVESCRSELRRLSGEHLPGGTDYKFAATKDSEPPRRDIDRNKRPWRRTSRSAARSEA